MPCQGPLTLREQFDALRSLRCWRVGFAVLLGFTLLSPTDSDAPQPEPVDVLAIGACPVPEEESPGDGGLVDLDGGSSMRLPSILPEEWRKAPCPVLANIRTVRGRCFLATGEKPPCSFGYDEAGECIVPAMATRPTPNTLQR